MPACVFCNVQSDQSQVASTLPAQYFKKKRGVANGLVYAGGGLGGAIISFCMNGLLEKVGPANTFRILGCINFATAMPAAWLIVERAPVRRVTFIEWYGRLPPVQDSVLTDWIGVSSVIVAL